MLERRTTKPELQYALVFVYCKSLKGPRGVRHLKKINILHQNVGTRKEDLIQNLKSILNSSIR